MDSTALKAVLAPIMTIASAVEKAQSDGKLDASDLTYLMPLMAQLGPAFAGAKQALEEYKGLSLDERAELIKWAALSFDMADDKIEAKVEAGLAVLIEAGAFLA